MTELGPYDRPWRELQGTSVDPPERVSEPEARWLNIDPPGFYVGPFPDQWATEAYMEGRVSEASALRDKEES